ncbi:MAG: SIS domain-containing protein [Actinobacteria bacterium]|nr:SIS domain-containing protein [Actinomycetota bacterium]
MEEVGTAAGHLVRADIAEQPAVLEGLLARRAEVGEALARFKDNLPPGVLLVARGSSDNAAVYGRYALEAATARPVAFAANSLWTRYRRPAALRGWLVIAISQSGATPEVVEVMQLAAESRSFTLAVTNDPDSELAASANAVLNLGAGPERAIPATKTYTATLLALALVAEALGNPPWTRESLDALPTVLATILVRLDGLDQAAELLASGGPSVHLGRGFLYGVALESALKVREMTGMVADGFSLADFLHGPIVATGKGTPAICHIGSGATRQDAYNVAAEVMTRGGRVLAIASDDRRCAITAMEPAGGRAVGIASDDKGSHCTVRLSLPSIEEELAAVPHAVAAQRLALQVALIRGMDPDRPTGLNKVTATT